MEFVGNFCVFQIFHSDLKIMVNRYGKSGCFHWIWMRRTIRSTLPPSRSQIITLTFVFIPTSSSHNSRHWCIWSETYCFRIMWDVNASIRHSNMTYDVFHCKCDKHVLASRKPCSERRRLKKSIQPKPRQITSDRCQREHIERRRSTETYFLASDIVHSLYRAIKVDWLEMSQKNRNPTRTLVI